MKTETAIGDTTWKWAFDYINKAKEREQAKDPEWDGFLHTPEGAVKLESYGDKVMEVFIHKGWIVVTGIPDSEDESEDSHNCDQMGCGQDHVLIRAKLPTNEK